MADFALVQAAANTALGTQDFTVSGFGTPKGALFFMSYGTANGTAVDHAMLSIGGTDGTRSRSVMINCEDAVVSSSAVQSLGSATGVIQTINATTQAGDGSASFDSWITDGVRIDWTDAPPSAYLVNCILLGGSGVSDVYVNNATGGALLDTATDVTDPGFEPSLVLTWGINDSSLTTNADTRLALGIVVNDGSNTQRSLNLYEQDATTPTVVQLSLDSNSVSKRVSSSPELQIQGFDANGFDLFTRISNSTVMALNYMAIKLNGISAKLLTSASPTGIGDHTITGATFTPQFGLMLHSSALAVDTVYSDGNAEVFGISAFTASTSLSSAIYTDDNVSTSNTESESNTTPVSLRKPAGTDFMQATFSAFTSDGATFNYTVADGTARQRAVLFIQASTGVAVENFIPAFTQQQQGGKMIGLRYV